LRQPLGFALGAPVFENHIAPGRVAEFAQPVDELPSGRIRRGIKARSEPAENPDAHGMAGRRGGRDRGQDNADPERNRGNCEHPF
jgi:hypothetical protein